MDDHEVPPPYKVEAIGEIVLLNGIQIYPHKPTPSEIAENAEKQEARKLLDSLHEEFDKIEKLEGHEKAVDQLRMELRKHPKYKNFSIEETDGGTRVDLGMGSDDALEHSYFFRFMGKKYRQFNDSHRGPLIDPGLGIGDIIEIAVNRVLLDPLLRLARAILGIKIQNEENHPGFASKTIQSEFNSVTHPLGTKGCVVVLEVHLYLTTKFKAKFACDEYLRVVHNKTTMDAAWKNLRYHFVDSDYMEKHLRRYLKAKGR